MSYTLNLVHLPSVIVRFVNLSTFTLQRHIVVDTYFGYDEESMDSESSSVASFRMDRTPATPDEDLDDVRKCLVFIISSRTFSSHSLEYHHHHIYIHIKSLPSSIVTKSIRLYLNRPNATVDLNRQCVCVKQGSSQWRVWATFPSADQGVSGLTASLRPVAGTERRHTGRWDGSQGTCTQNKKNHFIFGLNKYK